MLLGFPTWAQNGVTFATCCSYFLVPPLCTTLTYLIFFIVDVHFASVSMQRVSVVRQSHFLLSNNSLLIFSEWSSRFELNEVPASYAFAKGCISFGAARWRFFSERCVTFAFLWIAFHTTTTVLREKLIQMATFQFKPLSKMSWLKIQKQIGNMGNVGQSAKRTIDASKNRLFRIAIMSCACLLMNTAATVSMAVVLEDWSVSSNLWLRCIIFEETMTRDWAAYGLHEGSRLYCFSSARDIFWQYMSTAASCLSQPSRIWIRVSWVPDRWSTRP